ncbi:MAG: spherulation-specific family 4 protein [Gammaproteobacteria bacterium]
MTAHRRLLTALLPPCLVLLATVLAVQPGTAAATPVRLLVPAYANPCCDAGPAMWTALLATATQLGDGIGLILNPASGPGAARDGNFLDAAGTGPLASFHAAGGKVYAYVATGYATRPLADVYQEVNAYYEFYGAAFVDGIFFDEMSNDLADTGYYRALAAHVRAHAPGALVFGNPGTGFVTNPSAQTTWTELDYATALDVLMTFEDSAAAYRANDTAPAWVSNLDAGRVAHVVHGLAGWDPALLALARARNAGYLYFTDDRMPNPYDALATFWAAEVAAVSAPSPARAPATPVPLGGATLLLAPLLGALGWRAARRPGERALA